LQVLSWGGTTPKIAKGEKEQPSREEDVVTKEDEATPPNKGKDIVKGRVAALR